MKKQKHRTIKDQTSKYIYLKKRYFYLPFFLLLAIIVVGIIMMLTDQTETGYYRGRIGNGHYFELTGQGIIWLGGVLLIGLLWFRIKYMKLE